MIVSMKWALPMLALLLPGFHRAPPAPVDTSAPATHAIAIPLAIVAGQALDLVYPWRPDWLQPPTLVTCQKCKRDPVSGTTPTINWGVWTTTPAFVTGEGWTIGHNFTGGTDGQC